MPPRERPRRGAWWGSRSAKAGAAACLAALLFALAAPGPATAYRCEEPPSSTAPSAGLSSEDCHLPDEQAARPARANKRGSMSSLTVLVLAVAAVLLIPIGALGIPSSVDPFRDDGPY